VNHPKTKRLTHSKYLKRTGHFAALSKVSQLEILKYALERGASMRMTVYGESMIPFLRNADVVTISPFDTRPPQIGDILAFEKPGANQLVIHRLIRKYEYGYELKGDNCCQSDKIVSKFHLQGVVTHIERNSKQRNLGIGNAKRLIASLSRINLFYWVHGCFQILIKLARIIHGIFPLRNLRFARNEYIERRNGKKA
jgi:signal peptidase I